MANPFPFVAGAVLTAAQMNGIGETTSYTPTYTNFSLGNGTVNARYVRVQNLIYVTIKITCGTTSSLTGQLQISRPITGLSDSSGCFGTIQFIDVSTGTVFYGPIRDVSTTVVSGDLFLASGTYLQLALTGAGVPFTVATGDLITLNYVYPAA